MEGNRNLTEDVDYDDDFAGLDFSELSEVDIIRLERRRQCFQEVSSPANTPPDSTATTGLFCPRTFDGWSCWNETPAGSVVYQPCPFFITGFDPRRFGHKECLSNGTWFHHPESKAIWSNYTTCVDIQDLEHRQTVVTIQQVGYLISVCALIISLFIFCSFRCLECTRVRIHKHLFVSFIVNNVLWLIWYRVVITHPEVTGDRTNEIWCGTLHILVQYFLVANYFWMFCEGFYLHTLIVFTFTRVESKLLWGFAIFGWLGPSIPVGLYAICRFAESSESLECMIRESKWRWFLNVPVGICLISSLAFLINILRVLLTKLKDTRRSQSIGGQRRESSPGLHSLGAIRKAARATLILIPLLGLNYLLTPFRPEPGSDGEIIYEYISAVTLSLQGLFVSLLYCFCNGEVIVVLRRRFCRTICLRKTESRYQGDYSCGPTTMSTVVVRWKNGNGCSSPSPAEACV